MLRTVALLSVFGLLALVFGMALNSGGGVGFSLLPGSIAYEPMLSARTGASVTLEVVQKDVLRHRHTLHKLREQIGRASFREGGCQYVQTTVVGQQFKTK